MPGAAVNADAAHEEVSLRPLVHADVEAVHAIFSDPRTWRHLPSGRLVETEQSAAIVESAVSQWAAVGLGQWALVRSGEVVGVGGAAPRDGWWNLGFRLAPTAWGSGLATWIAVEAVSAAQIAQPSWPMVARSLTSNPASARVSEKAGLSLQWEGIVQGLTGPSPDVGRRIHADRRLAPDCLASIRALG